MLESHHSISSLITSVTTSRPTEDATAFSTSWTVVAWSYFSKPRKVTRSDRIDDSASRQLTAPLWHPLSVLKRLFKNCAQCHKPRDWWKLTKRIANELYASFCENRNI